MLDGTFKAHFALLEQRWPWPADAITAMVSYRDRLWRRVHEWRGRRVTGFQQAIEKLIAINRARPYVDSIVSAALAAAGEGSFQGHDGTDYTPPSTSKEERLKEMADIRSRLTKRYCDAVEGDREREAQRDAMLPDTLRVAREKIRAGCSGATHQERARQAYADSTRKDEPEDPNDIPF